MNIIFEYFHHLLDFESMSYNSYCRIQMDFFRIHPRSTPLSTQQQQRTIRPLSSRAKAYASYHKRWHRNLGNVTFEFSDSLPAFLQFAIWFNHAPSQLRDQYVRRLLVSRIARIATGFCWILITLTRDRQRFVEVFFRTWESPSECYRRPWGPSPFRFTAEDRPQSSGHCNHFSSLHAPLHISSIYLIRWRDLHWTLWVSIWAVNVQRNKRNCWREVR